ncbi:MAG: hypothetical protein GDA43_12130 [Hormoscilla sp. SP5CHS1]|nr:hypothetical protein [Hormoscilla sp. SP5CHS1]
MPTDVINYFIGIKPIAKRNIGDASLDSSGTENLVNGWTPGRDDEWYSG